MQIIVGIKDFANIYRAGKNVMLCRPNRPTCHDWAKLAWTIVRLPWSQKAQPNLTHSVRVKGRIGLKIDFYFSTFNILR